MSYTCMRLVFSKCNGTSDSVFASPEPCDAEVDAGVCLDAVVMRKRVKKRRSTTRLSVINGHMYNAEVTTLWPIKNNHIDFYGPHCTLAAD